jgi:mannose-1-phosphate guanylyltransferase / phosphomannomutase
VFIGQTGETHEAAEYVRATHSDFAFIINSNGEKFTVIDEKGNELTDEQHWAIFVMVMLLLRANNNVPIPNYASGALEILARSLNGKIIRTKGNRRDLLISLNDCFHFCFDALYAFMQTLQLLSLENCSLSQLMERIPHVHMLRDYVSCPWSARGVVMRKLIEETIEKKVDLLDGIKVYHADGGWTLILPELEEPIFTIYSQANDLKKARETAAYYIKKIRQYQNV